MNTIQLRMTKRSLLFLLSLGVLLGALLLSSCKDGDANPSSCADITCQNGGEKSEKSDGTCECKCAEGYGGDNCETMLANCGSKECPEGQEPNPLKDCLCE